MPRHQPSDKRFLGVSTGVKIELLHQKLNLIGLWVYLITNVSQQQEPHPSFENIYTAVYLTLDSSEHPRPSL
jgi:hypothetical protein